MLQRTRETVAYSAFYKANDACMTPIASALTDCVKERNHSLSQFHIADTSCNCITELHLCPIQSLALFLFILFHLSSPHSPKGHSPCPTPPKNGPMRTVRSGPFGWSDGTPLYPSACAILRPYLRTPPHCTWDAARAFRPPCSHDLFCRRPLPAIHM